jgi:hypothetical protein
VFQPRPQGNDGIWFIVAVVRMKVITSVYLDVSFNGVKQRTIGWNCIK